MVKAQFDIRASLGQGKEKQGLDLLNKASMVNIIENKQYYDANNVQDSSNDLDANTVRDKMATLGIAETDVKESIEWSRQTMLK